MVEATLAIEEMVPLSGSQLGTVLSYREHSATCRDLFHCHNLRVACYWHLVDRSQGWC